MSDPKTLIMKFGGSSIKTPDNFSRVADLIIKRSALYPRIAIVVSAMGGMTDQLISMAYQVHSSPPTREYDMLVSAGERISISLLAMALAAKGREAISFTGSQSGIMTSNQHTEARIIDVRPFRLLPYLDAGQFVIVAGFQGISPQKEITTLGRGGSDTTAVALGIALGAEKVEFYKDVPGIFRENPATCHHPPLCETLSYTQADTIVKQTGGRVLHSRAIQLAQKNQLLLHIRSFYDMEGVGTWIRESVEEKNEDYIHSPPPKIKPRYEETELNGAHTPAPLTYHS